MHLPRFARHRLPGHALAWIAALPFALALPFWPAQAAGAPDIWFGVRAGPGQIRGVADYPTLFRADNEGWNSAAANFQVFLISMDHLVGAPDDELQRINADLRRRHLRLAIEFSPVSRPFTRTCAVGEGYEVPHKMQVFTERLIRLHIRPDFVRIDGPLWFGHFDPQKCRLPIPELIRRVAENLSVWAHAFPDTTYGDVEPWLQVSEHRGWQQDYVALKDGIARTTGLRLTFVHSDVNESGHPNWPAELAKAAAFVRSLGMKYGMIYNGRGGDRSDRQWIADARAKMAAMEDRMHVIPDTAIIQSWDKFPTRVLPPGDPTTLSSLLVYYRAQRR